MELAVGTLLEGKVKTITNFGAFVALPENRTGMVHISEVANSYVSDIRTHLSEGQEVRVVVLGIDPAGKISLSIKRALAPAPRPSRPAANRAPAQPQTFEDKLKQFMSESDSKISGVRQYEHKTKSRRR
jgi:S1 RNA binding domain protein